MRRNTFMLGVALAIVPVVAGADDSSCAIPKGTRVSIKLAVPISSSQSSTGEIFGFSLAGDIDAPGCVVKAEGAEGLGTVFLAAHRARRAMKAT